MYIIGIDMSLKKQIGHIYLSPDPALYVVSQDVVHLEQWVVISDCVCIELFVIIHLVQ